jgi:hypothetical protein
LQYHGIDHPTTGQDLAMSQDFGSETPRAHTHPAPHRPPARYLVVIESGGYMVARLFKATREQVAEFDASTEEAAQMTFGLVPARGALAVEWDQALDGHSELERREADVYTLAV